MGLRDMEITENTTLKVTVQVKSTDGAVKPLTGATYIAVMGRTGLQVNGAASTLNAAAGLVQVTFPAAANMEGHVVASLHVTLAGETQCVWRERFRVYRNVEELESA